MAPRIRLERQQSRRRLFGVFDDNSMKDAKGVRESSAAAAAAAAVDNQFVSPNQRSRVYWTK